jgi:hypothetical protein
MSGESEIFSLPIADFIFDLEKLLNIFFFSNFHLKMAASARRVVQGSGGLDPLLDAKMNFETSQDVKVISSFDELGLNEDLLRGIYAYSASISAA